LISIITGALALSLFTGCATAPAAKKPGAAYIGMMPEQSDMFCKLRITENRKLARELYEVINDAGELPQQFWDRTDDVYMGITRTSAVMPRFSVAAVGNYPPALIKSNLNQTEEWELHKSEYSYFQHRRDPIQIAVVDTMLICLSNGHIQPMLERYDRRAVHPLPEEVRREFDISDVVVYIPNPGSGEGEAILPTEGREIPIQSLWITLVGLGEEYEASVVFEVEDEKKGRQVAMLSRLLLVAWLRKTDIGDISSLKEEVTVESFGKRVRIQGLRLDREEILKTIESAL
jgi:hypothetical protein